MIIIFFHNANNISSRKKRFVTAMRRSLKEEKRLIKWFWRVVVVRGMWPKHSLCQTIHIAELLKKILWNFLSPPKKLSNTIFLTFDSATPPLLSTQIMAHNKSVRDLKPHSHTLIMLCCDDAKKVKSWSRGFKA